MRVAALASDLPRGIAFRREFEGGSRQRPIRPPEGTIGDPMAADFGEPERTDARGFHAER